MWPLGSKQETQKMDNVGGFVKAINLGNQRPTLCYLCCCNGSSRRLFFWSCTFSWGICRPHQLMQAHAGFISSSCWEGKARQSLCSSSPSLPQLANTAWRFNHQAWQKHCRKLFCKKNSWLVLCQTGRVSEAVINVRCILYSIGLKEVLMQEVLFFSNSLREEGKTS